MHDHPLILFWSGLSSVHMREERVLISSCKDSSLIGQSSRIGAPPLWPHLTLIIPSKPYDICIHTELQHMDFRGHNSVCYNPSSLWLPHRISPILSPQGSWAKFLWDGSGLSLSLILSVSPFTSDAKKNIFILSPSVEGMKRTPKQGPHGASASL